MTRLGKGLVIGAGILALLVVGAGFAWRMADDAAVRDAEREARTYGLPMTVADLYPPTNVPREKNAFEWVPKLAATFPAQQADRKLVEMAEPDELRPTLAKRQASFPVLEEMTSLALYVPHRTAASLAEVQFTELATIKEGAKLLIARARVRAHDGDMAGAIADLGRSTRLAVFMENEQSMIGGLVKLALQAMVARAVADLLPKADQSSTDQLLALLDKPGPFNFGNALRTEGGYVASVAVSKNLSPETLGYLDASEDQKLEVRRIILTRPLWAKELVREYGTMVADVKSAPTDPEVASRATMNLAKSYSRPNSPTKEIGDMIGPVFSQAVMASRRPGVHKALLECAATALRSGKAPEVSATHDVFNHGAPFKLITSDKGWTLYSVGGNGVDDGGIKNKTGGLEDICVRYENGKLTLEGS